MVGALTKGINSGGSVGRVICIANQKGGVGKTTTAVNLSAALSLAGNRTLLVDLDPQSSASSGVGVTREPGTVTVYEVLLGEQELPAAIKSTAVSGLYALPASRDLIGAEIELVTVERRERRLAEALQSVRAEFDFILIDCPPSLGLLTVNGLTAADSVLIPLQCEYYALEGLTALLETVQLIRSHLNPTLAIEGLLLTMFDTRNSLAHQVAEEVRRHFPGDLFGTVVPRNVRLSEAPSYGKPGVIYDPLARGSQAYIGLAGEIREGKRPRTPVEDSRPEA